MSALHLIASGYGLFSYLSPLFRLARTAQRVATMPRLNLTCEQHRTTRSTNHYRRVLGYPLTF